MFTTGIRNTVVACLAVHAACAGDSDVSPSSHSIVDLSPASVAAQYADNAFRAYSDSVVAAHALDAAIDAFVADPTPCRLDDARDAWVAARAPYRPTEVFRFYGGPIDDPLDEREPQINAWPLDEAYIDAVEGNPTAGIVNDPVRFPVIDRDTLIAANFVDGESNVATGYHAIEFLLWGQDRSVDGPGDRPYTDFVDGAAGTLPNADRRRAYLAAASDLLIEDLEHVAGRWDPVTGDYRATFLADTAAAINLIGTGAYFLADFELAGERILTAYVNQDQEDEHSCFSDTTRDDLLGNVYGIENVYLGRWADQDGHGIDDLIGLIDPALDARVKSDLAAAIAAVEAIPQPFDQAIVGDDDSPGRVAVLASVRALQALGLTILDVGAALGVSQPDPESAE